MPQPPLTLRVLGPTELTGPDPGGCDALARQPKRLALLTYLTVSTASGFRRRDQVIPLFWNERDQAQSRTYLRKTLHGIRESLGVDPCLTRGEDELRVDGSVLWCDAVAIRECASAGEWEEVLSLYRGDLLDGVFAEGVAPEFQQWLDAERRSLRELAAHAADAASRACEASGDLGAAVVKARRARELDPNDERAVRRLIELLDRRGDRGAALKVYTEWQAWLFNEYGVEPDPETRKLANRVRAVRRGESHETPPALQASAWPAALIPTEPPPSPPSPARPSGAPQRSARRDRATAALAFLALALAVGVPTAMYLAGPWTPAAGPTSVAMLPLRTIGSPTLQPVSDAIAEELTTGLITSPPVVFRSSSDTRLLLESGKAIERVGRQLGVAYLVDGSLQRGAERHRLTLRLLRTSDAIAVWAGSYDFIADSTTSIIDAAIIEIAQAITDRR